MLRFCYIFTAILFFSLQWSFAQSESASSRDFGTGSPMKEFAAHQTEERGEQGIRVMFYNVENLFDTKNDSLKRDDDFTPRGIKGWSNRKYVTKLKQIYQTIIGVGGWEPPAVVGLCEVENRFVLQELITRTPLRKLGYDILHEESPDRRGIDVAMLYRPSKFQPIRYQAINITFPFDTGSKTRDVLYVKGSVLNQDTIHIFVNHWPSRFGGHLETDPKRNFVASVVREKVDSIYGTNPAANIVIMGDLNDSPHDESVAEILRARKQLEGVTDQDLFNMMIALEEAGKGTHKHQNHWGILDQIIVSSSLLQRKEGLHILNQQAAIYEGDFLIQVEDKKLGSKPFRTYSGTQYIGGYSDHLPIYLDLVY